MSRNTPLNTEPGSYARGARTWLFFVTAVDVLIALAIVAFGIGGIIGTQDKAAIIGLVLSIAVAHITTVRPFLRKPRLKLFIDEARCSAPTVQGDTPSWFVRLGVMNYGLTMAKGCVGRIIGVWTDRGERIKKFDPLTLYWSRQDSSHTGFNPVDIQGHGDIEYLDIAQIKKHDLTPLSLRVALRPPMTLSKGDDSSPSPGVNPALRPGTYYIQIAVYAEETSVSPSWFEIACSEKVVECGEPAPYHFKISAPPFPK